MFHMTPMVRRLVIANVLIYIVTLILSEATYSQFFCLHKSSWIIDRGDIDLYPFLPLQIITHFFSHSKGSIFHILFNMLALVSFGSRMELVFGAKKFLQFYLFCGVLGGIFIAFLDPSPIPVVGASGAIFGVLTAFAIYFPREKLTFLMPFPLTFEAKTWIMILGVVSTSLVLWGYTHLNSGTAITGGISHFGHLAGMVSALIFFYLLPLFNRD